MNNISIFKTPISDGEKQVGSMMIIRGIFPLSAEQSNANNYYREIESRIIFDEFKDRPIVVFHPNSPKYNMTVVIEGINDLPFEAYPLIS